MILITQPRAGTSHNEIIALQMAARELEWEVLSAPAGWRLDDDLIVSGVKGVPYGSQTFCEVMAQQMNWELRYNDFDWLARLPEKFLKRKVEFMSLAEAKLITQKKFIKPADDKVFPAAVYEPGTLIVHDSIPSETPTLVSDIVEFDLEYRCFTDGGSVLTWSNYIFLDHIADTTYWNMAPVDDPPRKFVDDLLHQLRYDRVDTMPSVIDVGRIPGKGWAIIETNQAWASGLYGCDPIQVLKVLEDSCA